MSGQKNRSFINTLAAEIVNTREFRELLNAMLSGFLADLGSQGKIKSVLAKQATKVVDRQLARDDEDRTRKDLVGLIQDSMARIFDTLDKGNPTLISDIIVRMLSQALEHMDFGDIKKIFENSQEDFQNLGLKINDLLFENPAKLILMLSFVPGLSNHLLLFLQDLIKRFNDLPADILTDILISFFKDVDEKAAGRLLNNMAELIRQVHTGSALIGDAGNPKFSNEMGRKARAALDEVDMKRLFKAANALVDGKEAVIRTLYNAAGQDPSFIGAVMTHKMNQKNSKVRLAQQKLELLESLSPEEAAAVLAASLSEWNAYESAQWINSACTTANFLHQHHPDALKHGIAEFVNTLDFFEIEESCIWISKEVGTTLQPVIQTLMPIMVTEVIQSLSSDAGDHDDLRDEQIDEMRQALRKFILNKDDNHG